MKVVIVGGVAAGASCAARLRRLNEQATIVVLQRDSDVSYASCGMPYYIGGEITDRKAMAVQTPESLRDRLNLDVRVNSSVVEINPTNKKVVVEELILEEGNKRRRQYDESYDELVLAVGATPLKPPIPGIKDNCPGMFALRNLDDMDNIASWIDKCKSTTTNGNKLHCVVAGAGFIGLEMVEQLVNRGFQVTLVEMMKQILGPIDEEMAACIHRDLEERGVEVVVGDGIKEFSKADSNGNKDAVTIAALQSGRVLPPAHLTILGLGVRPDTAVVKDAGIEVHPRTGHVIVNDHLQTSLPNIWAAGDSVLVKNPILDGKEETWAVPMAGPANRQGRMIADNICRRTKTTTTTSSTSMRKYKGTYGVSVVRSFDMIAACVGMNEKLLKSKSIPYATVHIHPSNHAGYYPGAQRMHMKLLFNRTNGKIYGAQAVGGDGVEKRIDVIATAMQGDLRVEDLAELELCYAPPVGSAKDPVNYIGMAAQNIIDGLVNEIEWNDFETIIMKGDSNTEAKPLILDVRNVGEVANSGPITKLAMNIPLNDLRSRIDELADYKDKHIVVSCASGQRSYYACRILMQNGFTHVDNLDGAYLTFHAIRPVEACGTRDVTCDVSVLWCPQNS